MPTWQANGRVLTILRVKNIVYIGGDFTQVMAHGGGKYGEPQPPGGVQRAHRHGAAVEPERRTGAYARWRRPPTAGHLRRRRLHPRGRRGAQPGGQAAAGRLGQAARSWSVSANGIVRTVKAVNSKVYMGGDFTSVNAQARAAARGGRRSGGALQGWAPKANGAVRVLLVSPAGSRVFVGGDFTTMQRQAQRT